MPKILANQREVFLENARRILAEEGYSALSIRYLAKESGVATGTLYNYFHSKEELAACIMLEDWRQTLDRMHDCVAASGSFRDGLLGLSRCIAVFVSDYRPLWLQYTRGGGSGSVVDEHHAELRAQIAGPVSLLINKTADRGLLALSDLLAEIILTAALHPDLGDGQLSLLAERLTAASGAFPGTGADSTEGSDEGI